MHVNRHSGDAIESGSATLPPACEHLSGPGLPFPWTIGPEHAVSHRGWCEARDRALAAVRSGSGLVLVLGPPGTGKTLLLQHLARVLRASGIDVLLSTRGDLDNDEIAGSEIGQRRVVLIDEADRMSADGVERLRRLGRCTFVLAGVIGPGEDRKPTPGDGTTVVRLTALTPDEVGAFVAARLAQAGLRPDLLTEEAIERLAALTDGLPRVLNMLTGSALFLARTAHASRVGAAHVVEAAALREGQPDLDLHRAQPSLFADPPPSDAHPVHTPPVVTSGMPLDAPPITLTGVRRWRGKRTPWPSRAVSAGLLAMIGLAVIFAWLLINPSQRTPQAVPRPRTTLAPTSSTRPASSTHPGHAPGRIGTTIAPPAASATPFVATPLAWPGAGVGAPVRDQGAGPLAGGVGISGPEPSVPGRATAVISAFARPSDKSVGSGPAAARAQPRHRADRPRTWRGGPHAEAPAARSGILDKLGERAPVESSQRNGGTLSAIATAPPPPTSTERRVPKYVGIYTTGPDGIRTFRASP